MFDLVDFYINFSTYGNVDYGDGNVNVSAFFDPPQGGSVGYEIDWDNLSFGDTTQDLSPDVLNGGAFDVYLEFLDLVANDPTINNLFDNADFIYAGNMEFNYDISDNDFFIAIYESIASGYYDDFFSSFWDEDVYDFSYQYIWDEVSGGYILEYV
jgi:hypothetical protein